MNYQPLPLMHADDGTIIDPRLPLFKALRREWVSAQRVTPRLLQIEAMLAQETADLRRVLAAVNA